MRRKGEDTFAMKRRRMPYVAKLKRDDPFRLADKREIEAMVKRIAAAGETFAIAGWRGRGLPAVPLPDLGEGARHAALDRPQRHRAPPDADALQWAATGASSVCNLLVRRSTSSQPQHHTIVTRQDCRHGSYFPIRFLGGNDGEAPK